MTMDEELWRCRLGSGTLSGSIRVSALAVHRLSLDTMECFKRYIWLASTSTAAPQRHIGALGGSASVHFDG